MEPPASPLAAVAHPDPYPYYAALVAERPFHRDETLGLSVAASAAAVRATLTSEICRVRPAAEPVPKALVGTPAGEIFARMVRMNDGAYHLRMKPTVSATVAMLDPGAVAGHTESAARMLAEQLEPAAAPDRIAAFAFSLPPYAVGLVLGLAPEALPQVASSAGDFVRSLAPGASAADVQSGGAAGRALIEAVRTLPRYRGASDEIVANIVGFFWQSYEATAALIGNTLLALARYPEARAVQHEPRALAAVVSEVTRHDAPVQNTRRFVAADGEIAGHAVREGDTVLVLLAAANRDPAANPDPARFDPARRERQSFTFSAGAHACPGEALAVAIASAGVGRLLAVGVEPERLARAYSYRPSANMRMPLFEP